MVTRRNALKMLAGGVAFGIPQGVDACWRRAWRRQCCVPCCPIQEETKPAIRGIRAFDFENQTPTRVRMSYCRPKPTNSWVNYLTYAGLFRTQFILGCEPFFLQASIDPGQTT